MKRFVEIKLKILDFYLMYPISIDLVFSIVICIIHFFLIKKYSFLDFDSIRLKSITSDLISTTISLAGFVLASLTIIITFKDNSKNQPQESGTTVLFNSSKYFDLVRIFYGAAIMLFIVFLFLTVIKISDIFDHIKISNYVLLSCILLVSTTVMRTIYLLIQIIKLQK